MSLKVGNTVPVNSGFPQTKEYLRKLSVGTHPQKMLSS